MSDNARNQTVHEARAAFETAPDDGTDCIRVILAHGETEAAPMQIACTSAVLHAGWIECVDAAGETVTVIARERVVLFEPFGSVTVEPATGGE